ncbi:MAG: NAD(P)-dependent oxidoreductase [Candidatus Lokiarchaeota archaeon]|nr:NAD(P)-dependent oxidoreductase [Candidatus Lokiarchaeota archaeon]
MKSSQLKVLLTGPFGNVGLSTLEELIKRNYDIRVFDIKNKKNRRIATKFKHQVEIIWGNLTNPKDVEKAVSGCDVIIHVAAIIPPLADRYPKLAHSVNVGGTLNIVKAIKNQPQKPKLIFTSSVAIYGDRLRNPLIRTDDPLNPNDDDEYAKQKVKCEEIIRNSGLEWVICRLTYIVSLNKLQMDPLMFEMPLDTCIEICDTKDVGLALANAIECEEIWGETIHIAGGERCRITYREYLNEMLEIFGIGNNFLPKEAFSTKGFHCGFMTTDKSQSLLHYQRHTIDDYFYDVRKKMAFTRFWTMMFRPFAKKYLLNKSLYYKEHINSIDSPKLSNNY